MHWEGWTWLARLCLSPRRARASATQAAGKAGRLTWRVDPSGRVTAWAPLTGSVSAPTKSFGRCHGPWAGPKVLGSPTGGRYQCFHDPTVGEQKLELI